ncbi:hypothetical protein [Stigmatella aurantiaca]|uniref:Conserved uncharacterized protein n=1 Tax=Stigmatella aurantiaca (strain DW4/3-1) TaxID=378806 RepID=E3FRE2_STIAD|nr:hypothetical protein [Stigmatella aurantiaca]ADO74534.1 conserved uncharacterized protein [Stigmatella aurantiaca DW4/3-1]
MKKTQVEQESRVIVGAHGVAAEEDHLILGKVISVGVISLVIFIVGGIWAWRIQVATEKEQLPDGPAARPAAMGQYEIGIVNQRLFEQDFHAKQKISAQQQALHNGWGDQPGVAAHPNLDQAMERVISDARRAPPPPPPAPETAPESPSPTSPPR